MPTAKKAASKKRKAKKTSPEVVMWLRLPRPMKVEELKKLGVKGSACFGGDTCIAATTPHSEAGLVVQTGADLQRVLDDAGLRRRADPCFGGDTCIV